MSLSKGAVPRKGTPLTLAYLPPHPGPLPRWGEGTGGEGVMGPARGEGEHAISSPLMGEE